MQLAQSRKKRLFCKAFEVKHNLTKIRRPQTNGMVERFNRRINEAISKKKPSFQHIAEEILFILMKREMNL
ncbi:MAG: hypothetical protein ACRCYZ_07000 [Alphaproteobacteria bacterium]